MHGHLNVTFFQINKFLSNYKKRKRNTATDVVRSTAHNPALTRLAVVEYCRTGGVISCCSTVVSGIVYCLGGFHFNLDSLYYGTS